MLVIPQQDMVYRNAIRPAGVPFEYDGTKPPACCVVANQRPASMDMEAAPKRSTKNSDK